MCAEASSRAGDGRRKPLEPLRRRSEFQRAYDSGARCFGDVLVLHARRRDDGAPARLGLTVSRKCGKACVRNRIRRRCREIVRLESERLGAGWDIVLTARQGAANASYDHLRGQIVRCLARLGVYGDRD